MWATVFAADLVAAGAVTRLWYMKRFNICSATSNRATNILPPCVTSETSVSTHTHRRLSDCSGDSHQFGQRIISRHFEAAHNMVISVHEILDRLLGAVER